MDTKKYIQKNLQAYADDKFFAFTTGVNSARTKDSSGFTDGHFITKKNGVQIVKGKLKPNSIEPIALPHKKRTVRRLRNSKNSKYQSMNANIDGQNQTLDGMQGYGFDD